MANGQTHRSPPKSHYLEAINCDMSVSRDTSPESSQATGDSRDLWHAGNSLVSLFFGTSRSLRATPARGSGTTDPIWPMTELLEQHGIRTRPNHGRCGCVRRWAGIILVRPGARQMEPREVWRVGRVAEGGGLLNRCRTKSSTGGSNPPLSATNLIQRAASGGSNPPLSAIVSGTNRRPDTRLNCRICKRTLETGH